MAYRRAPASASSLPPRFASRRSGCSAAPPRLPADGRERKPTARQLPPSPRRSQIQHLMQAFRSVRLGPTRHVVLPVHSLRLHSGHAPLRLSPRALAASPCARAAASLCSTSSCSSCSDHLGESVTCRASIHEECCAAAHCPLPAARAAPLRSAAHRLASTLRRRRRRRLLHMASRRRLPEASGAEVGLTGPPLRLLREMWAVALTLAAFHLFWALSSPAVGATQPRGPWASGASFVSMCVPIYVFLVVRCARW